MLAITVHALQRENTIYKALAGIVKKGTKAIKTWIEPTDLMWGLHRHMEQSEGMPHAYTARKHGSHIYVAGVTCMSLTSRIPIIP